MGRDSDEQVGALVARAVAEVVAAPDDRLDLALDVAASQLAAQGARWPELSRAALHQAEEALGRVWAGYWRPADLLRTVRRQLRPVHAALAVDAVAAEARRYPAAALDRRWRGQLQELGAKLWWGDDGGFLTGFAQRHRLDRFGTVTALLELVRLCSRLPRLHQAGPVPGRGAGDGTLWTDPVPGEPKLLGRIRALLAKAESTDFPEEAEALSAKAQELMARHSIDAALLAARTGAPDTPGALRIGVDSPYESAKALLLDAVASANRAKAVWDKANGFGTVIGFEADLDAVELLYTSLLVQGTAAMNSSRVQRGGRTRSFRQSFLVAYADRIRQRLLEAADTAVAEAAADVRGEHQGAPGNEALLPVLAARQEAVDEHTARLFPRLAKGRAIRATDWEGWEQGRAAADRASLHTPKAAVTP